MPPDSFSLGINRKAYTLIAMSLELTQPNSYVFHFTSVKTLMSHILPKKQIRFSPLGLTNDPRESQDKIFAITGGKSIDDNSWCDELVQLTNKANKILRKKYLVLCTTRNDPAQCYKTVLGIGYSHARMWAQYAEDHNGSCIVFEKDALNREICKVFGAENVYQGAVIYTDKPLKKDLRAFQLPYKNIEKDGIEKTLENHVNVYYDSIFLRKYKDWNNEWEYRWIIKSKSGEYEFVSIVDAIKAVFVSIDFPKECLSELKRWCETLKIYGGEIKWPNGYPSLWKSTIFDPG